MQIEEPSQTSRQTACAAYLMPLVGGWILIPALLLWTRGRTDRFAGEHAAQALLLQLVGIWVLLASLVLTFVYGARIEAFGVSLGLRPDDAITAAILVAWGLPSAVLMAPAVGAMRGMPAGLPLIGAMARALANRVAAGQ